MSKIITLFKTFALILIAGNLLSCSQEKQQNKLDSIQSQNNLAPQEYNKDFWYLSAVNASQNLIPGNQKDTLLIAIVDDGVRTSHQDLKNFIWNNPKEIPRNNIDDDGNGYVDDVNGWDVSDNNNSILPAADRLQEFYHGTHLAGIISQILTTAYGDVASERVKLLPVKALADQATQTYIKDGYKGIEYAIQAGADIILCAWGVEHIAPDDVAVLNKAREQGILIISTAGNFPTGNAQYPAAAEGVLAVSATDKNDKKPTNSNFGVFVDLMAPGVDINSTSAMSDDAYEIRSGTSQSAAITVAGAALLKLQFPDYSWSQITACLKHNADPLQVEHPRFIATQGAGGLNIQAALACDLFTDTTTADFVLSKHQDYLSHSKKSEKVQTWTITPPGEFKGLRFKPEYLKGNANGSVLEFISSSDQALLQSYPLEKLPEDIFIADTSVSVVLKTKKRNVEFLMSYQAEPINFSELYCKGTVVVNEEGTITDGSGDKPYAFDSNCKWQVTAPPGKVVQFDFTQLHTQTNVDKIYFFNGKGTHEDTMAIFSGATLPPQLKTWSNEVLVWFVSDGNQQGKGWEADITFVDR